MTPKERKGWAKASPIVKREGIKLITLDNFHFKILEPSHPQAYDLHYIVRDITFSEYMYKLCK